MLLGLAGAFVGVAPTGASAVPAPARCRATAFVANSGGGTVSAIDVKTRTKYPTDIPVGTGPISMAITPDGKTGFVDNFGPVVSAESPTPESIGTVSTIDVKTRTKDPTDIPVGALPFGVAVTPDGKTAFVTNVYSGTVSTIDVKTRTKHASDIAVGSGPLGVAVTPCRR